MDANAEKMTTETIVGNENASTSVDFAQTVLQQFEDISTMVKNQEMIKDRWGDEVPRYYAVDIQDNEVIVIDRNNNYQYFGFAFTMNGDKAEIDFASGCRKKLRYENYEDTQAVANGFDFGSHIAEIEDVAYEKVDSANKNVEAISAEKEEAETNYSAIKADYDAMKVEYDKFVEQEHEREVAEANAKKNEIFSRFETALGENAEFAELKKSMDEFSVDEIKNKCSVIFADAMISNNTNFEKNNKSSVVVGILDSTIGDEDETKNGYVSTKYGNIPHIE